MSNETGSAGNSTNKFSCGRKEEPAVLISRFLLRMHRMYVANYVASIRLDFH